MTRFVVGASVLLVALGTACGDGGGAALDPTPPIGDRQRPDDGRDVTNPIVTPAEPDATLCGSLRWERTLVRNIPREQGEVFLGLVALPSSEALVIALGTTASCPSGFYKPTSSYRIDEAVGPANAIESTRCVSGLAHDGTRLVTASRLPNGSALEIIDLASGASIVPLNALPGLGFDLAIGDARAWFWGKDGLGLDSIAYPSGDDRKTSSFERVGAPDTGPRVGLTSGAFGIWSARHAFEGSMQNFLFVVRPNAPKGIECAFPIERYEGLTGAVVQGMAARGNEVFVLAGTKLAIFEHAPPGS
jgi:hypothetical protein